MKSLRGLFQARSGPWHPTHYVVASVVDAAGVGGALAERGFADADIEIRSGDELLAYLYGSSAPAAATRAVLREMLMTEGEECWGFAEGARRGNAIVGVYAPESDRMRAAHDVLAAHGAESISYYRAGAVVNLSLHPGV